MKENTKKVSEVEALARSAVSLSIELNSKVIVCMTKTGDIATHLAKYRPEAFIVAVSFEDKVIKGLTVSRGVICLRVPSLQCSHEELVKKAI